MKNLLMFLITVMIMFPLSSDLVSQETRAIFIDSAQPEAGGVYILETESVYFSVSASDSEYRQLGYSWTLDGVEVSTGDSYTWVGSYESAGIYVVECMVYIVDDPSENLSIAWSLAASEDDRDIVVESLSPAEGTIVLNELESQLFTFVGYDPDGTSLSYIWTFDGNMYSGGNTYEYTTDYYSAGLHTLILDVMDGNRSRNIASFYWDISVNDVLQPIEVYSLTPAEGIVYVDEGQSLDFEFLGNDPEGYGLTYYWTLDGFQMGTENSFIFSPGYTWAGEYNLQLDVNRSISGRNTRDVLHYYWTVVVNDVDQPIQVNNLSPAEGTVSLIEGESQVFSFDGYDPDGNSLTAYWILDGGTVSNELNYTFYTDQESAGIYALQLRVTDSVGSRDLLVYDWTIEVTDVDQPIVVDYLAPEPGSFYVYETDSQTFTFDGFDPDGSNLTILWELDGLTVGTSNDYTFYTDYTSAGYYQLSLTVSDGYSGRNTLDYSWSIEVINVDQPIVVNSVTPGEGWMSMNETESVTFTFDGYDPDGNNLEFYWWLDSELVGTSASYEYITDYSSAGYHTLHLNVSDGSGVRDNLGVDWYIDVYDVDRPIVVTNVSPSQGTLYISETDSLTFSFEGYDPDGNSLSYNWTIDGYYVSDAPTFVYRTDFNSAGYYFLDLEVHDGTFTRDILYYSWNIEVADIDQPIVVNEVLPAEQDVVLQEGETMSFSFDGYDPDGTDLQYYWLLDGTTVSTDSSFEYAPGYADAGLYTLYLEVFDGFSGRDFLSYFWTIEVTEFDQSIVVTNLTPAPGTISLGINELQVFTFSGFDPDGNDLTFTWKRDNQIAGNDSIFSFSSDIAGSHTVTLDVSDQLLTRDLQSFSWTIEVTGSTPLAAPQAKISILTGNTVEISWNPVQNATTYRVYSANNPYAQPADWTLDYTGSDLLYQTPVTTTKKFYRVTAE